MLDNKEVIKAQNQMLRAKINKFKQQSRSSNSLQGEIDRFVAQSGKNLQEMNQKVIEEAKGQNEKLRVLTGDYEQLLKRQIELLNINKDLSNKKELQQQKFNGQVEEITNMYEGRVKEFQSKVKNNVKRIQQLGSNNSIKRLLRNEKFKQHMSEKGCSMEVFEQQSELQDISTEVEEIQQEIKEAENKLTGLDEQMQKMHELVQKMKQIMQNMALEKENIIKQNTILKEKLKQSEELIGKLLGAAEEEQQQQQQQLQGDQQDGQPSQEEKKSAKQ